MSAEAVRFVRAHELSRRFSATIREWLTAEQLAEVINRNAAETCPSVCHSHDFIDANMAMDSAGHDLGLDFSSAAENEELCELWNKAWDMSKEAGFSN